MATANTRDISAFGAPSEIRTRGGRPARPSETLAGQGFPRGPLTAPHSSALILHLSAASGGVRRLAL